MQTGPRVVSINAVTPVLEIPESINSIITGSLRGGRSGVVEVWLGDSGLAMECSIRRLQPLDYHSLNLLPRHLRLSFERLVNSSTLLCLFVSIKFVLHRNLLVLPPLRALSRVG
jgi:hypothetical protein